MQSIQRESVISDNTDAAATAAAAAVAADAASDAAATAAAAAVAADAAADAAAETADAVDVAAEAAEAATAAAAATEAATAAAAATEAATAAAAATEAAAPSVSAAAATANVAAAVTDSSHTSSSYHLMSIFFTFMIVFVNVKFGWGYYKSIMMTVPLMVLYNLFDIHYNWESWTTLSGDKSMPLHHTSLLLMIVVFGIIAIKCGSYTNEMYRVIRWMLLMEISSIFFNLRALLKHTAIDLLFGISFLVIRPISTIGSLYDMIGNSLDIAFAPFVLALNALNVYWGYLILQKIQHIVKKRLNDQPQPKPRSTGLRPQTCLAIAGLPILAVLVYNRTHVVDSGATV